jgi:hypothetical protein
MKLSRLMLAVLFVLATAPAAAQGNQGGDDLPQSGTARGDAGAPSAPAAHVGAGTVDGTTTGFSKPDDPGGGGGPPALTGKLCEAVDPAAREDCLSKVLGSGAPP